MARPDQHVECSLPPRSTRRLFFCGSIGALALLISACGGGGGDYSPPPPPPPPPPAPPPSPPPALSCGATAVSANHGHTLTIPAADVDSTVAKTYSIAGAAGHDHTITLSPAQLAQIKAKTAVTVTSSVDVGHFHDVTVNCA